MTEEEEQGEQFTAIVQERMEDLGWRFERDWWFCDWRKEDHEEDQVIIEVEDPNMILGSIPEIAQMSRDELLKRLAERATSPCDLHDQISACRTEYDDLQARITHALTIITRRLGYIQDMPSLITEFCTYQDLIDILEGRQHGR